MAFDGEPLKLCLDRHGDGVELCEAPPFDWSLVYVVIVSGNKPSPCGHALLNVGVDYFHVD